MANLDNTRKVFGEALAEYGVKNKKVVVLTADVSSSVMTTFLPRRYRNAFSTWVLPKRA